MSHDNPLIPLREILEIPNSQLPVLLVDAVEANNLNTCHNLIRGEAVSTHVTLSSGEKLCRLASHSHPGRSHVDSHHTLIRGGAVSTRVTLSSGEERHTLIRGGALSTRVTLSSREEPVGTAFICPCILGRNVHVHVVSFNCYSDFLFVSGLSYLS